MDAQAGQVHPGRGNGVQPRRLHGHPAATPLLDGASEAFQLIREQLTAAGELPSVCTPRDPARLRDPHHVIEQDSRNPVVPAYRDHHRQLDARAELRVLSIGVFSILFHNAPLSICEPSGL
ncbi:hypothetical protein GCM10027200_76220 [Lentzea nigeriaca]